MVVAFTKPTTILMRSGVANQIHPRSYMFTFHINGQQPLKLHLCNSFPQSNPTMKLNFLPNLTWFHSSMPSNFFFKNAILRFFHRVHACTCFHENCFPFFVQINQIAGEELCFRCQTNESSVFSQIIRLSSSFYIDYKVEFDFWIHFSILASRNRILIILAIETGVNHMDSTLMWIKKVISVAWLQKWMYGECMRKEKEFLDCQSRFLRFPHFVTPYNVAKLRNNIRL